MNRSFFAAVIFFCAIALLTSTQASAAVGDGCTGRTNTILGVESACGCHEQAVCLAGPECDEGYRMDTVWVLPFCRYSGYSEEPDNTGVTVPSQENRENLWGWSDVHEHQFANLAYGGVVFWGKPFDERGINSALAWGDYTWDFQVITPSLIGQLLSLIEYPPSVDWLLGPMTDALALMTSGAPAIRDLFQRGYPVHGDYWLSQFLHGLTNNISTHSFQHPVDGTGAFSGWPHYYQGGHQQMYYKWLERAYQGGLRLMVNHAVNNKALCWLSFTRAGIRCDDMNTPDDFGPSTVDLQINAMWELQHRIDAMSGGPGKGWYRIAKSAEQARSIIRQGKMAVVIGIEVDTLFGCGPDDEFCDAAYIREQIAEYRQKGVTHIFPLHFFDNRFGGGALYADMFTIADVITDLRLVESRNCADEGYLFKIFPLIDHGEPWADCNARGLTPEGQDLIDALIDADMIIDIDHLSARSLEGYEHAPGDYRPGVLDLLEDWDGTRGYPYPAVSGHPMIMDEPVSEFDQKPTTIERIRDLGGIASINMARGHCSTTYDFLAGLDNPVNGRHAKGYHEVIELMSAGGPNGEPFYGAGFPGVSLITDMGAFLDQTGPRFVGDPVGDSYTPDPSCPEAASGTPLIYPFPPFDEHASGEFGKQKTGDRTFNFNTDGLAHIGLMPDLLADTMNVGLAREELDPLFNSAETFVRMWERIENCTPDSKAPAPGVDSLPAVNGVCSATVTTVPTATDFCSGTVYGTTTDPLEYHDQGFHTVTWTYTDEQGNSSTQKQVVSVIDNVPPTIDELSASPDRLWPPTNKMVPIEITAVASDNCDAAPACMVTSVSSNEPEESSASKVKTPDWIVTGDLSLEVRSEKAKSNIDRVYDIEVSCSDYAGNTTTGHTEVRVPHDES